MRYCAQKPLLAQIWQFKIGTDLEKLVTKIKSALHHVPMLYPCKSGWNLPTSSWDMVHTSTFGLKFSSLSPTVILKIRSRSPKPQQLFIMSQCYIHVNLVKIHPPVQELSCKQESVTLTPTGSAPKTMSSSPSVGAITRKVTGQSRLSRDVILNTHTIAYGEPNFVWKLSTVPNFVVICGMEDMIDEKQLLKKQNPNKCLGQKNICVFPVSRP